MNIREYEITISPSGEVEIHMEGFKGKGCLEAVKFFEQVVGEAKDVRQTSAFFEPDEEVHYRNEQHH